MPRIRKVVLDFDGTLTQVDKEAVEYTQKWKEEMTRRLGYKSNELNRRWRKAEQKIRREPSRYGWKNKGRIIAPAYADPLIMTRTIADVLCDEAGIYPDETERDSVFQDMFHRHHGSLTTVFKRETNDFLEKLKRKKSCCVVTNSHTDTIQRKISQLPEDHTDIPIYGNAKKYELDLEWTEVPESRELPEYGRPLYLQRRLYGEVLKQVMGTESINPEEGVVVGDVHELDLLLPEQMGMHVILVPRESTPEFERRAIQSYPRGYVATSLPDVIRHIESIN